MAEFNEIDGVCGGEIYSDVFGSSPSVRSTDLPRFRASSNKDLKQSG